MVDNWIQSVGPPVWSMLGSASGYSSRKRAPFGLSTDSERNINRFLVPNQFYKHDSGQYRVPL